MVGTKMKKVFFRGGHFLLDLASFLCYRKMAKENCHDHPESQSPILWSGIYFPRAFLDPGSGGDLCRDQPNGAVAYGVRTAGVEATQWRSQRSRVPEAFGEVGKPGIFNTSGEPGHRTEERYKATHCASDRQPTLGQTDGQCGGVFALGIGVGQKPEAASAFQGSCKPAPLPGICHGLRSEASVLGVRDPAWTTSGWMRAVFQSGLADEGQGSMDRLGRCDTRARSSADRKQQPIVGLAKDTQSGQRTALLCAGCAAKGLAGSLWSGSLGGRDTGGPETVSWGVLPGGQFYRAGGNERPGSHGPFSSASWGRSENSDGVSADQACGAPSQKSSRRIRGDECTGNVVVPGAAL